jgi:hypothetical protein
MSVRVQQMWLQPLEAFKCCLASHFPLTMRFGDVIYIRSLRETPKFGREKHNLKKLNDVEVTDGYQVKNFEFCSFGKRG